MSLQNIIIGLVMLLLTACTVDKEQLLYRTYCNGASLEFSVKEKKHFAYRDYWMELTIEELAPLIVRPNDVTEQTVYDFALLHSYPHYLYDTISQPEHISKQKMILFIHPDTYSKADFETIHTCLSQHIKQMEMTLYEKYITPQYSFYYPQISGIVYAHPNDFTEIYNADAGALAVQFNGAIIKLDAQGKPAAQDVFGIKLVSAKQDTIDHEAIFPSHTEWMNYKNTKTGRAFAEDYSLYSGKDNIVYAIRNK